MIPSSKPLFPGYETMGQNSVMLKCVLWEEAYLLLLFVDHRCVEYTLKMISRGVQ